METKAENKVTYKASNRAIEQKNGRYACSIQDMRGSKYCDRTIAKTYSDDKEFAEHIADEIARKLNTHDALLEACKAVLYFHDTDDTPAFDQWGALRAAIARAESE